MLAQEHPNLVATKQTTDSMDRIAELAAIQGVGAGQIERLGAGDGVAVPAGDVHEGVQVAGFHSREGTT